MNRTLIASPEHSGAGDELKNESKVPGCSLLFTTSEFLMHDVAKHQYALLVDPLSGREFKLSRSATTVGRAVVCDIVLTDKSVSRQHCVVYCMKGQFFIEDCGSTNGTTLNQEFIFERRELMPGDEVRVGLTPLIFLLIPDRNSTEILIGRTSEAKSLSGAIH